MNRRHALCVFIALGAAPLFSVAQTTQRPARVGYLSNGSPNTSGHLFDALKQGMRKLGYTEGKDVTYEVRFAMGKARAQSRARERTART